MNQPLQPLKVLDREQNTRLRSVLFRHLDGFPIVPTMISLKRHGVLELFENRQTLDLNRIVEHTGGNEGYLQVAMRLLCSQGWLVQNVNSRTDTIKYTSTNRTRHAFQLATVYDEVAAFIPIAAAMGNYLFGDLVVEPKLDLMSMVVRQRQRWDLVVTGDPDLDVVQKQILLHLDGLLVGPVLVALGMRGVLSKFSEGDRLICAGDLITVPFRARA